MRHLGIERAHFAACMPRDWVGLLTRHKNTVASLTLMCPMASNWRPWSREAHRRSYRHRRQRARRLDAIRDAKKIAGVRTLILENYFSPPWADPIGDRRDAIGSAMREFIKTNAPAIRSNRNLSSPSANAPASPIPVMAAASPCCSCRWRSRLPSGNRLSTSSAKSSASLPWAALISAWSPISKPERSRAICVSSINCSMN